MCVCVFDEEMRLGLVQWWPVAVVLVVLAAWLACVCVCVCLSVCLSVIR